MTLTDEVGWIKTVDNNQDDYGKAAVDFARTWADMMEPRIQRGEKLEDIAKQTSIDVDTHYGITGFMYGMAVSILAQVWKYGPELRKWHNAQYGSTSETGTVNPALLSIGTSE